MHPRLSGGQIDGIGAAWLAPWREKSSEPMRIGDEEACLQKLSLVELSSSCRRPTAHSRSRLLFYRNPQRFHLAVEVAALQTQNLGGAAHVAVVLIQFLEDVVALVGGASLVQGRGLAKQAAAAITVDQRRQMLAVELEGGGIHDHDTLHYVAQFAHVARPGIAHQAVYGVVSNLARAAPVGGGKLLEEVAG